MLNLGIKDVSRKMRRQTLIGHIVYLAITFENDDTLFFDLNSPATWLYSRIIPSGPLNE